MEFGPILRAMTRSKVRYGLIVLEIALTLAVVTNCVSLIRDAQKELGKESGFDDANILTVRSQPFAPAFQEKGYLANSVRAGPRRPRGGCRASRRSRTRASCRGRAAGARWRRGPRGARARG